MVLAVEARKLSLSSSSISPRPSSFIFDSNSLTLAVILADSSISLYSPLSVFSVFSSSSLPPPQTLILESCSSACFVRFDPRPNFNSLTLFVAAGPSSDGSRVLIRLLVKSKGAVEFVPARVRCGKRGMEIDQESGGVLVDCADGLKVVVAGSVNYFAMYSPSAAKVWVFGVNSVVEDQGMNLKLVKCALIDCQAPVTALSLSNGLLIMGELNGVRVFSLRRLVKRQIGRKKETKKLPLRVGSEDNENLEGKVDMKLHNSKLPNGFDRGQDANKNKLIQEKQKIIVHKNAVAMPRLAPNGVMGAQIHGTSAASVKSKSQRPSQDSNKRGFQFLPFNVEDEALVAGKSPYSTKKAISIHGFSQNTYLVADSEGSVHILCASISGPSIMKQLPNIKEVQQFAVLPDVSEGSRTVWLSDGYYSVHVMEEPDTSTSSNSNKRKSEDVQLSVIQTIFVGERIRDVQPLSANAVLILGQENLYAYAIS